MRALLLTLMMFDVTTALSKDSRFYSESAVATAKIEGAQHYATLEAAGVLGLQRSVKIRGRVPDGTPLKKNEKLLHLIRHGQGFHNLLGDLYRDFGRDVDSTGGGDPAANPYARPEIADSPLTAVGREQAKALRRHAHALEGAECVVVSPLQRAVQTAALGLPQLKRRVDWIGHPLVTETSGVNICDRRRDKAEIADDFPWVKWDLLATERDEKFDPSTREAPRSVSDRGYEFLLWLRHATPYDEVVVATHSAWLFTLLNTVVRCDGDLANWFLTGELRSIIIEYVGDSDADVDARVKAHYGYTYPLPSRDSDSGDDL